MNKMKYLAALLIGVAGLGLQQAQATSLDLQNNMHWSTNDPYLIGTVIPGTLNGGQAVRDAAMTNTLLGMAAPSQTGTWGEPSDPLFSRTNLNTTGYPAATTVGAAINPTSIPDGGATLTITLTGSFQYLVVAYDGRNSGVAVFDIHTLVAGDEIVLARYAFPADPVHGDLVQGDRYRMTTWSLLNPTTAPDGGTTVMLLGAALGALGMARRFVRS
jgi:VPDSG-CTERM motif